MNEYTGVVMNVENTLEVIWEGGLHYLESAKWRRRVIQLGALKTLFTAWDDELANDIDTLADVARQLARDAADEEANHG
jgi:hypothetical protein